MAVELATAYVALTVETSKIAGEVKQGLAPVPAQAAKAGSESGKRFASGMRSHIKGMVGMFGGMFAAIAIKDFVKDSLASAKESARVGNLTKSIIKSTGGAAKVTEDQVKGMAQALAEKTGVDRKQIQAGSNLILTFKNIKNEAGANNDVFNQATAAALDLSKAGFGSMESASKMMGKALNDPVKGLTALGRAGVTFSDAQKEQIKTMVKSGDTLGAQKIILKEVQSQVGGAAEATATSGGKVAVAMDEIKETLGGKLATIIKTVNMAFLSLVEGFKEGTGVGGQLKTVWELIAPVLGWIGDHLPLVGKAIVGIMVATLAWRTAQMGMNAVAAVQLFLLKLQTEGTIQNAIVTKIAAGASKVWAAGQWLLNAALNANPISLIILAIVALVGIVVLAYKKNETFRKIVQAVWAGIKAAVLAVVNWFKNTAWPWIKDFFAKNVAAYQLLRDKAKAVWDNIKSALKAAWDWIGRNVFNPIKAGVDAVKKAFEKARDGIKTAWDKLQDIAKKPIKFIINTVLNDGLIAAFNWLSGKIGGPHIDRIKLPKGFATGGMMPGYTPGRDVHRFYSPTGGLLELSGGEPIMRPEFGRVVGKGWVDSVNAAARTGGVGGVRRALGAQGFAGGGIWDNIKKAVGGAVGWVTDKASDVWKAVTNPVAFLKSKLPKIPAAETIAKYGEAAVTKGVGAAASKITGVWKSFKSLFDRQGSGAGNSARTVSELTAVVKRILPDTRISSGYRPGAITALGNVSQHSKGLAIDIVPHSTSRFDKIKNAFPHAYQLFYSPRDGQTLLRGKPWRMDAVTKRDHWDHIHLSNKQFARGGMIPKPLLFDSGGTLPTGTSLVHNGTGAPEHLVRADRYGPVTVILSIDDVKRIRELDAFFDMLDKARVNQRKSARSGRVAG